jgi:hypothetical protein
MPEQKHDDQKNEPKPEGNASPKAAPGNQSDEQDTPTKVVVESSVANIAEQIHQRNTFDSFIKIVNGLEGGTEYSTDQDIRKITVEFGRGKEELLIGGLSRQAGATPAPRPEQMPASEEKIIAWFNSNTLSHQERYAIRATAILHGAPAHEISKARIELYETYKTQYQQGEQARQPQEAADAIPLNDTLLSNIWAEVRLVSGIRRLFWQGAESNGYSTFNLTILRIIAGEIEGTRGIQGQDIREKLEEWACMPGGERPWRAARALGAIWWMIDHSQMRIIARRWANSASLWERRSAAGFLYGAYEMERNEASGDGATSADYDADASNVLDILRKLTHQALTSSGKSRVGEVVVATYGLIGQKWPDIALDGLDYLLGLTPFDSARPDGIIPYGAFIQAILTYMALAGSGYVRPVMEHLAEHAERYAHTRSQDISPKERTRWREQRDWSLEIVFIVFFFIAAFSFVEADDSASSASSAKSAKRIKRQKQNEGITIKADERYDGMPALESFPQIPDDEGRDILLLGVLAPTEEIFRSHLVKVFCAALSYDRTVVAMDLLRRWAVIVYSQMTANKDTLRASFQEFLIAIGTKVGQWDDYLQKRGLDAGFKKYTTQLERWLKSPSKTLVVSSQPRPSGEGDEMVIEESLGKLAGEVLARLRQLRSEVTSA